MKMSTIMYTKDKIQKNTANIFGVGNIFSPQNLTNIG